MKALCDISNEVGSGLSTYTLKYRPPDFATCPPGWVLVERGRGGFFPLRTDLPDGVTRFGVIGYKRCLTKEELISFEMEPVIAST